jgi:hypothetical protein
VWPAGCRSRDLPPRRIARHAGEQLADREAELGVERQRPGVVARLQEPDPRCRPLDAAPHDVLHQSTAHATVLDGRVDRDRSDAVDGRPPVQEVAADDSAVRLRHHGVEVRALQHGGNQADPDLGGGKVRREPVTLCDGGESLIGDAPAGVGVLGGARSKLEIHHLPPSRSPIPPFSATTTESRLLDGDEHQGHPGVRGEADIRSTGHARRTGPFSTRVRRSR